MSLDSSTPIDDYYVSRITLSRIETVYHNGFMSFFELISKSPDFFNNAISSDDLFKEFISDPINEIKEKEKDKKKGKEITEAKNSKKNKKDTKEVKETTNKKSNKAVIEISDDDSDDDDDKNDSDDGSDSD